MNKKKLEEL